MTKNNEKNLKSEIIFNEYEAMKKELAKKYHTLDEYRAIKEELNKLAKELEKVREFEELEANCAKKDDIFCGEAGNSDQHYNLEEGASIAGDSPNYDLAE